MDVPRIALIIRAPLLHGGSTTESTKPIALTASTATTAEDLFPQLGTDPSANRPEALGEERGRYFNFVSTVDGYIAFGGASTMGAPTSTDDWPVFANQALSVFCDPRARRYMRFYPTANGTLKRYAG